VFGVLQETQIISLDSINRLVCVMRARCVYWEVGTELFAVWAVTRALSFASYLAPTRSDCVKSCIGVTSVLCCATLIIC